MVTDEAGDSRTAPTADQPTATTLAVSGCPAHYIVVTGETVELMVLNEPVEYNGGSAYLDPRVMKVDFPYPVELNGHTLVVVKRSDGALDFLAVPVA
jgi:hypothetical protein